MSPPPQVFSCLPHLSATLLLCVPRAQYRGSVLIVTYLDRLLKNTLSRILTRNLLSFNWIEINIVFMSCPHRKDDFLQASEPPLLQTRLILSLPSPFCHRGSVPIPPPSLCLSCLFLADSLLYPSCPSVHPWTCSPSISLPLVLVSFCLPVSLSPCLFLLDSSLLCPLACV